MVLSPRLNKYFEPMLQRFIFDELAPSALARIGVSEVLGDVPVPLQVEDMEKIASGEGISAARLAVNMAYVMGCAPGFKYQEAYLDFMDHIFKQSMYTGVLKAGETEADGGALESACVYFRAALVLRPDDLAAMYGYAMICRELYLAASKVEDVDPKYEAMSDGEREEYIGLFKAETLELLENMTILYPKFAESYYYLGYAYMNMGLYIKADMTFEDFLTYSTDAEKKLEIRERRDQLKGPVEIEQAINAILAGRFGEGVRVLSEYAETKEAGNWWPLHYYLGMAMLRIDMLEEGIKALKKCLTLNPSHIDSMSELIWAYEALEDETNASKYRKKLELIRGYIEEDAKGK